MKTSMLVKSVAALALLGALPAAAGQASYSGSLCEVVGSGSTNATYFNSGRLLNQTASPFTAVCPLQRNVSVPSFTEDMTVSITVVDQHATQGVDVCCTATVAEADGTAITSGSACSSGSNANPQTLSINLASVFAGLNGYLSLRCSLPGQYTDPVTGDKLSSVLSSFLVTE
jgi:hypothetical protein